MKSLLRRNRGRVSRVSGAGLLADLGRPGALGDLVETLEPRVLLSSTPELGAFLDPAAGYTAAQLVEFAGTGPQSEGEGAIRWVGGNVQAILGSYVVTFDEALETSEARQRVDQLAGELGIVADDVAVLGRGRWAMFDAVGALDPDRVGRAVFVTPRVIGLEPNAIYQKHALPNDERLGEQWHLDNTGQFIDVGFEFTGFATPGLDISADEAWDVTVGSRNVVIAVVDDGVDYRHPDLAANIYRNTGEIEGDGIDNDGNGFVDDVRGWDFGVLDDDNDGVFDDDDGIPGTRDDIGDNDPDDDSFGGGHGTSVAGLIGAVGNNGIGVTGVNWNVSILPLKIANDDGSLSTAGIVASFDYITMMRQRGVNIVAANASFGATLPDETFLSGDGFVAERIAVENMTASGATLIASAGNDTLNLDTPIFHTPSDYDVPGVISVAATTPADTLAFYSNFGATEVDIAAPASATLTTDRFGQYTLFNGTSAAAPVVTGVVGLLKSVRPDLTPSEVRQIIIDSADFSPALAGQVVANGRLNAARALEIAGVSGPVLTRSIPGPITAPTFDDGSPVDSVTVQFSRPMDPAFFDTAAVTVTAAGVDEIFNTGDDRSATVTAVSIDATDARIVDIALDTSDANIFTSGRLASGQYQVTLDPEGFRDLAGMRLNGDGSSGVAETFAFEVITVGAPLEANDTLGQATAVDFTQSGEAELRRLAIGDGVQGALDVDMFRITAPSAGLITAEVTAQRLALPSQLDAQLRLFDVNGNEIASNDQFFGSDPFISFFVATDGVYYLGVSGFGNGAYDPLLSGSGASQTVGAYDVRIGLELAGPETVVRERDLSSAPLVIPSLTDSGPIESTLTFTDARTIRDLDVTVDLEHGRSGDLRLTLVSPAGTEIVLSDQRGGENDGFPSVTFDDEASDGLGSASGAFSGSYKPDESLGGVSGESGAGDWILRIEDLAEGVGGRLLGWSLTFEMESDIAGPFEQNDTVASAFAVTQVQGSGTATFDAAIGDGPFGLRDRDLFSFQASAGGTLTAFVTPGEDSALDASLRLFDDLGREVLRSAPSIGRDAAIDRFVIAQGGTYYLGVAEQANVNYDAFNALSGTQGQTSGIYTLGLTLTPGLSDNPGFVAGEALSLGLGTNGEITSLRGNTTFAQDFVTGGPETFFGVSADGIGFVNGAGETGIGLPMSVTNESDAINNRFVTRGQFRGLDISRTITFGESDSFIAFDVTLTNRSGQTLSDVAWVEGLNPDHGAGFLGSGGETSNDIFRADTDNDGNPDTTFPYVTAQIQPEFFQSPISVAFGAASSSDGATPLVVAGGALIRDASQALAAGLADPDGQTTDNSIGMGFELGSMAPNQTETRRYFIFMDDTELSAFGRWVDLENGVGTGHLAADPAAPAGEMIAGEEVPSLPYRLYYPEGFSNEFIYTFLPVLNPNDEPVTVHAIARYETGERDQVLGTVTIEPNARGGLTLTTPELFAEGEQMVRGKTPYGIELRSDTPVAATLSYYDTFLLEGERAAVGESFTSETSRTWSFGGVTKADGVFNFLVFMNTEDNDANVTTTFFPESGGEPIVLNSTVGALRRGGWNLAAQAQILPGRYGVLVEASTEIVAALSAFDNGLTTSEPGAAGSLGLAARGSRGGVIPEGQFGLSSESESLGFLNTNEQAARVQVTFQFESGSSFRTIVDVPAQSRAGVEVGSLVAFPAGEPYSVSYTSDLPVTAVLPTYAYGDGFSASLASEARTMWGFGEGFRTPGQTEFVEEFLRLHNPGDTATLVEVTLMFDNGLGTETIRETIEPRSLLEIDLHDLVTGDRRNVFAYFGTMVQSAEPIVAYMNHYDPFFPGGFGTLGTPLGGSRAIDIS